MRERKLKGPRSWIVSAGFVVLAVSVLFLIVSYRLALSTAWGERDSPSDSDTPRGRVPPLVLVSSQSVQQTETPSFPFDSSQRFRSTAEILKETQPDRQTGLLLSTVDVEFSGWADDALLPFLSSSPAVSNLDDETPKSFCQKQVARTWKRAKERLAPPLYQALLEMKARHEAVATGEPLPGQKYIVWSLSGGVGNRFLSLTSTFMVAVLSGRVLLMKDWFTPLPKAGTKQEPVFLYSDKTGHRLEDLWKLFDIDTATNTTKRAANDEFTCPLFPMMSLTEFRLRYPEHFEPTGHRGRSSEHHLYIDLRSRHDKKLERWNRFLCGNLKRSLKEGEGMNLSLHGTPPEGLPFFGQTFVYVWTNQYFIPGLFANPYHAVDMKGFFPQDRPGPYETLVRLLIIPALPVVRRVRSFFHENSDVHPRHFAAAQIRAFQRHAISSLAADFDKCMGSVLKEEESSAPFFLASMHQPVREYFQRKYKKRSRSLAPPRHDQPTGQVEGDQEALADMLILSLSKSLFLSGGSTFGTFAAAFGGHHPTLIANGKGPKPDLCLKPPVKELNKKVEDGAPQPCFGSWFHYDHLAHRGKELKCNLLSIPEWAMRCKG